MTKQEKLKVSICRISNLPDDILFHILSFLPTKDAVRTSILSTRWKGLYVSVPSLDFDDSLFLRPKRGTRNRYTSSRSFMNFVDRMLFQCHRSRLNKFRLACYQAIDSSRINSWICSALGHDIRELELWVCIKDVSFMPPVYSAWKTLVVLKLGSNFVLDVPAGIRFPCLKILHLDSIVFLDNSIQRLFSNCPVLEDFSLRGSEWKSVLKFNISSPTLERLDLNCLTGEDHSTKCKFEIVINAPRLVYLNYSDYVPESCSLVNLHSLAEAHIGIELGSDQLLDFFLNTRRYHDRVTEIARGIRNVQALCIYGGFFKALSYCCKRPLPMFNSLTCLKLEFCKCVSKQTLPELLRSSPNLETLIFEAIWDDDMPTYWHPPDGVPSCLLNNLETIIIRSFQGTKEELIMVEYFLKNAQVLRKMMMNIAGVAEREQLKITKKLLMLPRASDRCQVEIL